MLWGFAVISYAWSAGYVWAAGTPFLNGIGITIIFIPFLNFFHIIDYMDIMLVGAVVAVAACGGRLG